MRYTISKTSHGLASLILIESDKKIAGQIRVSTLQLLAVNEGSNHGTSEVLSEPKVHCEK